MHNRIKFWLLFVLLYILAFFIWWTYSLMDLNQEKFSLLLKNEELRAKQECMMMRNNMYQKEGEPFPKESIENYAQENCKGLELFWDEAGKPDLRVSKTVIDRNTAELKKEHFKYLTEGITMFIMIAIGIIWIFVRIGKILNLSKQQNNFLLSVSHELKTPITAIQLSAQTLNRNFEKLNTENKFKLLDTINANTGRLNGLIDQMLILTRIEGSQYKYDKQDIDLKELVNGVIQNSSNTQLSHFTVINNIPSNAIVFFDRLTFELCFSNLIENSIKYSPNGGTISINGISKGGNWHIEVCDEGVGIKDEEKKRVFEKFYRVGNEDTRTSKGTGLGLYLVKQILSRQNASIRVKDNEPNGSIFVIKLKIK